MEVKGTAVRSTPLYVRQRFGERYDEWLDSLSEASRSILQHKISTNSWYDLNDAYIQPTYRLCELFYEGEARAAWEIGRFSAEYALWGLYRVFVRFGSPTYLIRRASEIFSTYYRPSKLSVDFDGPTRARMIIEEFPQIADVIEYRIGGWMERALEISGCSDVQSQIKRSMAQGDEVTEYVGGWR
jgi:hypothetical protein